MRGVTLLAQAPDLHERLQEVAEQGWSHVVLDEGTNRLVKHMKRAARGFRNRATTADEYGCTELTITPDASGDPVAPAQDRRAP